MKVQGRNRKRYVIIIKSFLCFILFSCQVSFSFYGVRYLQFRAIDVPYYVMNKRSCNCRKKWVICAILKVHLFVLFFAAYEMKGYVFLLSGYLS